jgi:hypothetical protein
MTHTITPTPEQFAAIQRGEGIEIVERVEPQPNPDRLGLNHHRPAPNQADTRDYLTWFEGGHLVEAYCPYALGDRIAVVCSECGGTGTKRVKVAPADDHVGWIPCGGCHLYRQESPQLRVSSIAPREIDGVWCWVVECEAERRDRMSKRAGLERWSETVDRTSSPLDREITAELRALWAVVEAAQAYRQARQEESGQAIAERELCEALYAYEEGQDG